LDLKTALPYTMLWKSPIPANIQNKHIPIHVYTYVTITKYLKKCLKSRIFEVFCENPFFSITEDVLRNKPFTFWEKDMLHCEIPVC
jgi:hypothetical protein